MLAPDELSTQLAALQWHYDLVVAASDMIAVLKVPCPVTLWLVALELSLEICSVWIGPSSLKELVLIPFTNVLHACRAEDIRAVTVFFSIEPVARKHVLIGVNVHSLALFLASHPLSIILTLISVDQSANTILEVGSELTSVDITVGVSVLALALSVTVGVKSLVNLSVGVGGGGFSGVVF